MEVIPFYESLLAAAGYSVDENHYIKTATGKLWVVDGKPVVLPVDSILANPDWDSYLAFHPAMESAVRRESVIFKALRKALTYRLSTLILDLMYQLLTIAIDTDKHSALNAKQTRFLKIVPNANAKTLKSLKDVIQKAIDPNKPDRRVVNIFISQPGFLDKVEYSRAAIVTFPMINPEYSSDTDIFGIKMTLKDKKTLLDLFGYLLPNTIDPDGMLIEDTYSVGSSDETAPSFVALITAFGKIVEELNVKVKLFKNLLQDVDTLLSPLDWINGIEEIDRYRALIPMLPGNEGETVKQLEGVIKASEKRVNLPEPKEVVADKKVNFQQAASGAKTEPAKSGKIPFQQAASMGSVPIGHNPLAAAATSFNAPAQTTFGSVPNQPLMDARTAHAWKKKQEEEQRMAQFFNTHGVGAGVNNGATGGNPFAAAPVQTVATNNPFGAPSGNPYGSSTFKF